MNREGMLRMPVSRPGCASTLSKHISLSSEASRPSFIVLLLVGQWRPSADSVGGPKLRVSTIFETTRGAIFRKASFDP